MLWPLLNTHLQIHPMNVHNVYRALFRATGFRRRRMQLFTELFQPTNSTRIVDIGGYADYWAPVKTGAQITLATRPQITLLNLDIRHDRSNYPDVRHVLGNALSIPFASDAYDIAHSNSVIEHLSTWQNQQLFAQEVSRIAPRVWVQTPAREFFVEPHVLTPFVHWLPRQWNRRLLRNFTIWGWITRPTPRQVEDFLREVRLLTYEEMSALFPDCTIWREKWMGITKSYIAYRL